MFHDQPAKSITEALAMIGKNKKLVRRKNHKRRKYDKGMVITVLREAKRRAIDSHLNLTQVANWIAEENGWSPKTIAKYLSRDWDKLAPLDSQREFKKGEGILGNKDIKQISYTTTKRPAGKRDSKPNNQKSMDFSTHSTTTAKRDREQEAIANTVKKPDSESILVVVSAGSDVTIHANCEITIQIRANK